MKALIHMHVGSHRMGVAFLCRNWKDGKVTQDAHLTWPFHKAIWRASREEHEVTCPKCLDILRAQRGPKETQKGVLRWLTYPMGGAATERTATAKHSHAVNVDTMEPLCGRVRIESLVIDNSLTKAGELPTCPRCRQMLRKLG